MNSKNGMEKSEEKQSKIPLDRFSNNGQFWCFGNFSVNLEAIPVLLMASFKSNFRSYLTTLDHIKCMKFQSRLFHSCTIYTSASKN